MTFQIKLARTSAELDELFQARHRVFVDEMTYLHAEPEGRLFDRFDAFPTTRNLIALAGGRIIAGVRLTEVREVGNPGEALFSFEPHLPRDGARVCAGSMLFIDPAFRGTPDLLVTLFGFYHVHALALGFTCSIAAIAPAAEQAMLRVGYRPLAPRFFHEEKRLLVLPMLLDLRDLDETSRAFARAHPPFGASPESVRCFPGARRAA